MGLKLIFKLFYFIFTTTLSKSVTTSDLDVTAACQKGNVIKNDLLLRNEGLHPLNYTLRVRPVFHDSGQFKRGEVYTSMELVMEATKKGSVIVLSETSPLDWMVENSTSRTLEVERVWNIRTGKEIPIALVFFDVDLCVFWERKYIYIKLRESYNSEDIIAVSVSTSFKSGGRTLRYMFRTYTHPISGEDHEYFFMGKVQLSPVFRDQEIRMPFKVIIGRQREQLSHRSLSNMDISHSENDSEHANWVWDHFHVTPPITRYYVAAGILDLSKKSIIYDKERNKTITYWAPGSIIDHEDTNKIFQRVVKILHFYETIVNMEYPVSRLDLLWQEIGSRHYSYLGVLSAPHDPQHPHSHDLGFRERFVWDDFETHVGNQWFKIVAPNFLPPPANGLSRYVTRWFQEESLKNSSASEELELREDWGWGDFQAFEKLRVAAALWMVHHVLGRTIMITALSQVHPPQANETKVTTEPNFLELLQTVLEEAMGKNETTWFPLPPHGIKMEEIFQSWFIPVANKHWENDHILHVSLVADNNKISITHDPPVSLTNRTFWVPIEVHSAQGGSKVDKLWLHSTEISRNITISGIDISQFLLVNPGRWAPYGVLYEDNLTNLIAQQLKENHERIPLKNRLQLVNDNFKSLDFDRGTMNRALDLTLYFRNELSPTVWKMFLERFRVTMKWVINENPEIFAKFSKYMEPGLFNFFSQNGGLKILMSSTVLPDYIYLLDELKPLVEEASEMVSRWKGKVPTQFSLSDNMMSVICLVIRTESQQVKESSRSGSTWDFVLEEYQKLRDFADQKAALDFLKCTRNATDFARAIDISLNGNFSRDDLDQIYRNYDPWRSVLQLNYAKDRLLSREIKPEDFKMIVTRSFGTCYGRQSTAFQELPELIQANEEYLGSEIVNDIKESISFQRTCNNDEKLASEIRKWLQK